MKKLYAFLFSFVGTVGLLGFALAVNITSTDSFGNAGTSNNVPGWVEVESNGQNKTREWRRVQTDQGQLLVNMRVLEMVRVLQRQSVPRGITI